jgi:hypothetical protein
MPQTPPIFEYAHTGGRCSITGGYVYRGAQRNVPDGQYVYADYCSAEIWRWDGASQILMHDLTGRNILSFGEDEDGEVYVLYSNGQIDRIVRAGASADFDGDLKTDVSVFRPSTGTWFINFSSNLSNRFRDSVLRATFPYPRIMTATTLRTSPFSASRTEPGITIKQQQFGRHRAVRTNGDVPAAGDYDGDGRADLTVFRPSTGTWYRLNTSNGATVIEQFGLDGDIPVPGDYDGDGKYDVAVWRPSNGVWYRRNSSNPSFVSSVGFGLAGDVPAPGDYGRRL